MAILIIDSKKVISFDAGFTLLQPAVGIGEVYRRVAQRKGYDLDAKTLELGSYTVYKTRMKQARENGTTGSFWTSEQAAQEWWNSLAEECYGQSVSDEDRAALAQDCFDEFAKAECWSLYPDVLDTLEKLKAHGLRLCICSNWDKRLLSVLEEIKLIHHFDEIFISSIIGFEKPDTRVFTTMLDTLKIEPHELLHIGDSAIDDIQGAASAQVDALIIRRPNRPFQQDEHLPGIDSLQELL